MSCGLYGGRIAGAGGTVGAMNALINLAVAETNQSYINSNITQRVRLVHSEQVTYTESGDVCLDRDRVRTRVMVIWMVSNC